MKSGGESSAARGFRQGTPPAHKVLTAKLIERVASPSNPPTQYEKLTAAFASTTSRFEIEESLKKNYQKQSAEDKGKGDEMDLENMLRVLNCESRGQEPVIDRILELLMKGSAKQGYDVCATYAHGFLIKHNNLIVPAIAAIKEDIDAREATLEAVGRVCLTRECALIGYALGVGSLPRDERLRLVELDDAQLVDFKKKGWESMLGKQAKSKPESDQQAIFDIYTEEGQYRYDRVVFHEIGAKALENGTIDKYKFKRIMRQFDGLDAGWFDNTGVLEEAPGLSGRGYVLKKMGYPKVRYPYTKPSESGEESKVGEPSVVVKASNSESVGNSQRVELAVQADELGNIKYQPAQSVLDPSDVHLPVILQKLVLNAKDQRTRAHKGYGLQLTIDDDALPQGNTNDPDVSAIETMQAMLNAQAEEVRMLKAAVGAKERDVEAEACAFQEENKLLKKTSGKGQGKSKSKASTSLQAAAKLNTEAFKLEGVADSASGRKSNLAAERARALDKLINYDRQTRHLHDSLFKSHANIIGEGLHSRDEYDLFSAKDVKQFQKIHENANEAVARTMLALAAGSAALATALWNDVETWVCGYLLQKGVAYHEIEAKHLENELCRFAMHFYHRNCRG